MSQSIECPTCHKNLAHAVQMDGDDKHPPRAGDVTVCAYCATPLVFTGDAVRAMTEQDVDSYSLEEKKQIVTALLAVRRIQLGIEPPQADTCIGPQYALQVREMAERFRAWVKAHPEATPLIQFNHQANVFVVAPIWTALETHAVSANEDGRAAIHAMCDSYDQQHEPTIFMVKLALEAEDLDPPPSRL